MQRKIAAAFVAGIVTASALSNGIQAQESLVEITEWDVEWTETRPRDPHLGPDGRVWFVGQTGHYVAVLNPEDGEFTRYDLPDGAGPHNLIVDDEGIVWYTGNRVGNLGRLDPATGEIEIFPMPDPEKTRDPHTLIFGADDDMWFSVQGGNQIGWFDPATGETELWDAPMVEGRRGMTGVRPYGMKLDSKGNAWSSLFGSNLLAMVDRESREMSTYELPEGTRPRRLVIDSNDVVWYVDYARGKLGRFDPETHEISEWDNPGGEASRPYGVAIDADDRVWFVETGSVPNQFVGFDTRAEEFISVTPVGNSRGAIRHMYYDEATNAVWFGADWDTVGRAQLPPLGRRVVSDRR